MKTRLFFTATCLALLLGSCHKTYNCTCEPDYGIVNGQIKAINSAKAKDHCDKNCGHNHSSVSLN